MGQSSTKDDPPPPTPRILSIVLWVPKVTDIASAWVYIQIPCHTCTNPALYSDKDKGLTHFPELVHTP